MARKRVTVEQWITEALSDQEKGAKCNAIALVYLKAGGVGQEEITTKQNLDKGTINPRDLAQYFINKATGFSQDLPGISTFRLLAFYGQPEPQATFPFTVADGDLTGGGDTAFAKHEPTNTGLLGQLMKHNEQMSLVLMQLCTTVTVQSVQRESQLRQDVNEAQMIVRDVIMNMHKEQHESRMAQLRFARESEERQLVAKALPSLLNQLTGREIIPQNHADSELLDAIATKVKPEHLNLLVQMGILEQQQAALLAARFTRTLEEKEKQRQALLSAPAEDTADKPIES